MVRDMLSFLVVKEKSYPKLFIKWEDTTLAVSNEKGSVYWKNATLNSVVSATVGNKREWSVEDLRSFLKDRIPDKNRRDIEKILKRCGLINYDEIDLAIATKAIHARDLFWITTDEIMIFKDAIDRAFREVFLYKVDQAGGSINSPEGLNVKRYGISKGFYGIYKNRLHPYSLDAEAEVVCYKLAELLKVPCCPSWMVDGKSFSKFEFEFSKEYLFHVRRVMEFSGVTDNLYQDLISAMPDFKKQIQQVIVFDFITRQTDRHMSNLSLRVVGDQIKFYPLYDNGRSLFYEDREELILDAVKDIPLYSTEFGPTGTYYDFVCDIAKTENISSIVNLNVSDKEVRECLAEYSSDSVRQEGAFRWVTGCLQLLRSL